MLFRPLADAALERWVRDHPEGYVLNVWRPGANGHKNGNGNGYDHEREPVLHRASCGLVSSPAVGHHVDERHVKICALDFNELVRWAERVTGKALHPCGVCVP